ncbi:hypothetical protein [Streptosporangium canum]|uniref:hypothetical protein n=1 Tax=Streptosporangium canum TaxID=324952 RepID=UPI003F4B60DA
MLIAGFDACPRGPGLEIAGIRLTAERYGVAPRAGDPRACQAIDGAIGAMYADGTMRALLERDFGRVGFRFETGLPRLEDCRYPARPRGAGRRTAHGGRSAAAGGAGGAPSPRRSSGRGQAGQDAGQSAQDAGQVVSFGGVFPSSR